MPHDAEQALIDTHHLVWSLVRRWQGRIGFDDATADDWFAETQAHLFTCALAAYDADRGAVSTFVHACAERHLITLARRRRREGARDQAARDTAACDRVAGGLDPIGDARIEAVADQIAANPTRYFTPALARVFIALRESGPRPSIDQLAARCGLSVGGVSITLHRLRRRVAELSGELLEAAA